MNRQIQTSHALKLLAAMPLAAGLLALTATAPAFAQTTSNYPDRPVRLIVPFPAGSLADIISRIAVPRLSSRLGQQFLVENRAGATGQIGSELIARAAPDGYSMGLITATTHGVVPALGAKLSYDPLKDFKPVSMIGEAPYVLVLYPGIAARNVAELVAYAKTRPGQINYGSAGIGSVAHLAAALFAQQTEIELNHVPYKSTAQSAIDLITGRLHMQVATVAPTLQSIRESKLRALATTGKKRMPALPDVPTMIESGVKDYQVALWLAYAMPAATPDAITRRLNAEMTAILTEDETAQALRKQGFEPETGTPEAVSARIRSEIEMWRALIARTGIKVE